MQELSFKIFEILTFVASSCIDDVEATIVASGWVKIESIIGKRPTIVIFQMSVLNAKNMPGEDKVEVDFSHLPNSFDVCQWVGVNLKHTLIDSDNKDYVGLPAWWLWWFW